MGLSVWDGRGDAVSAEPLTLRVDDGRIVALGTAPERSSDAEGIDCAGAFAVPGLIDGHVHMTLDPEIGPPAKQLAVARDVLHVAMVERARAMLLAGITTARDLGGGEWSEFLLRDRIAAGLVPGPRLLCAGQPVTSPDGHCHFWGGEARTPDELRAVVARQLAHDADCIKVMATGGVMTKGTKPREAQFDADEIRVVVEAAAASGRLVAAHCHSAPGIRNASEAGVRTVEHCSWSGEDGFGSDFDPEVLAGMAGRELWISATPNPSWGKRLEKEGQPTPFATRMKACMRAAREAGVPMIASTDAGIPGVRHDVLPRMLPVFAEYAGLSPVEALRAVTCEVAKAIGLERVTGRLADGLSADVLIVDGNPLDDLSALQSVRHVVARGRCFSARGRVVSERGAAPLGATGGL